MKQNKLMAIAAAVGLWAVAASGQTVTNNFFFAANQAVPEGDLNGLALSANLSGMSGEMTNVSVTLNVSGGFNGDLYAYLVHDTGFAVLLNRVGMSSSNSFGYADAGFSSVVFNDAASGGDIHFYGGNGGLALSGTYQPDGRTVNPVTPPPGSYDTAPRDAMLSSFQGVSPDGTWTLFVADLSAGAQSTLVSWDVQIVDVPEPATWALAALGAWLVTLGRARWRGFRPVEKA
jgi:subtilisin-like proprotein convertase family protein